MNHLSFTKIANSTLEAKKAIDEFNLTHYQLTTLKQEITNTEVIIQQIKQYDQWKQSSSLHDTALHQAQQNQIISALSNSSELKKMFYLLPEKQAGSFFLVAFTEEGIASGWGAWNKQRKLTAHLNPIDMQELLAKEQINLNYLHRLLKKSMSQINELQANKNKCYDEFHELMTAALKEIEQNGNNSIPLAQTDYVINLILNKDESIATDNQMLVTRLNKLFMSHYEFNFMPEKKSAELNEQHTSESCLAFENEISINA